MITASRDYWKGRALIAEEQLRQAQAREFATIAALEEAVAQAKRIESTLGDGRGQATG